MSTQNKIPQSSPIPTTNVWLYVLQGYIKTVATIPAYTPKTFEQAVKIYMDSLATPTVKRLYLYSFEAKIWNYITLT